MSDSPEVRRPTLTDPALAAFDTRVRRSGDAPNGWTVERVGGVTRITSPSHLEWGCFVEQTDLDEVTADAAIAETVTYYGGLGRRFEWKHYDYDLPPDLPERLASAGFVAEDPESLVIGRVEDVVAAAGQVDVPGVHVRVLSADADAGEWDAISGLHDAVWGEGRGDLGGQLREEAIGAPSALTVYLAEAHEPDGTSTLVCAAWVRFHEGTGFASLWGGSTLPAWRRRGIYRSLVGRRAREAAGRGAQWLQVDASPDSRPILERLGLRVVAVTTPYIWTPPAAPRTAPGAP